MPSLTPCLDLHERAQFAWRRFILRSLVQLAAYQRLWPVAEIDQIIAEPRGHTPVEEKQRQSTHPRSERTGRGDNAHAEIVSCKKCELRLYYNGEPVFAVAKKGSRSKSAAQPRAWQSTSEREARGPEPVPSSSSAGLADGALATQLVKA